MPFPFLTVIIFTPIVAGVILLFFPAERHSSIRRFALVAASLDLLLSLYVYLTYDQSAAGY